MSTYSYGTAGIGSVARPKTLIISIILAVILFAWLGGQWEAWQAEQIASGASFIDHALTNGIQNTNHYGR